MSTIDTEIYKSLFACPRCLNDCLLQEYGKFICHKCDCSYEIIEGIPVFRDNKAQFYWGLKQEKMEKMLNDVSTIGWHDAMMRLLDNLPMKEAEIVWSRTLGPRRMAMNMLLPLHKEAKILDIGSGWGVISMNLARYCKSVVAMDQMMHHLKWLEAAAKEFGVNNISLVNGGDTLHLPFPSGSFDIVILNGVFEWVASNTTGNPKAVQQRFLKEVARVLNPEGIVYIGIENRLNYKYFLGYPEGHINMRFGALLPRPLTRLYLKLRRNQPFREYTYSLFGYKKLLRKAGLNKRMFYVSWPHYSSAGFMTPIKYNNEMKHWHVETEHPAGNFLGFYFSPSYVMTASKEKQTHSIITKVLNQLVEKEIINNPFRFKGALFKITSTGKAVSHIIDSNNMGWHLQIGLTTASGRMIEKYHRAISWLYKNVSQEISKLVPASVITGSIDGFVYGVEPHIEGKCSGEFLDTEERRKMLCEQAFDFISRLHTEAGMRITIKEEEFKRLFAVPIRSARQWFTGAEWKEYSKWFEGIEHWMREILMGKSFTVVPYHGDFVPNNCIVTEKPLEIIKVLDWELFDEQGLPLLDWICFLRNAYDPLLKAQIAAEGKDPAQVRFHGYPEIFVDGYLREMLYRYLDKLNLDRDFLLPLLFMWWIKQLTDWAPLNLYHPHWRKWRVFPIIERWETILSKR